MKMLTVNLFYCVVVAPPVGPFPPAFGSFYSVGASSRFCELLQRWWAEDPAAEQMEACQSQSSRKRCKAANLRAGHTSERRCSWEPRSGCQLWRARPCFCSAECRKAPMLVRRISSPGSDPPPSVFTIMLGLDAPNACDLLFTQTLLFMPTAAY